MEPGTKSEFGAGSDLGVAGWPAGGVAAAGGRTGAAVTAGKRISTFIAARASATVLSSSSLLFCAARTQGHKQFYPAVA